MIHEKNNQAQRITKVLDELHKHNKESESKLQKMMDDIIRGSAEYKLGVLMKSMETLIEQTKPQKPHWTQTRRGYWLEISILILFGLTTVVITVFEIRCSFPKSRTTIGEPSALPPLADYPDIPISDQLVSLQP